MVRPAHSIVFILAAFLAAGCAKPQGQSEGSPSVYASDRCGEPGPGWSPQGSEFGHLMARNTVWFGPDRLTWNGARISAEDLQSILDDAGKLNPSVNMQVVYDEEADCRHVRQMRALIAAKLTCTVTMACVEYSEAEYEVQAARHAVY